MSMNVKLRSVLYDVCITMAKFFVGGTFALMFLIALGTVLGLLGIPVLLGAIVPFILTALATSVLIWVFIGASRLFEEEIKPL